MRVCASTLSLATTLFTLSALTSACNKEAATVEPEPAAEVQADASEPEPEPAEASPAMIATYQGMASDVYGSDAVHCLEDEMENEGSRYMRAAYTLNLTIDTEGVVTNVQIGDVMVQVRNYEGEVLKEGNAESMGKCVAEAAKGWEFEPAPPSETSFPVSGSLGD